MAAVDIGVFSAMAFMAPLYQATTMPEAATCKPLWKLKNQAIRAKKLPQIGNDQGRVSS
jgi:hypothetical protein